MDRPRWLDDQPEVVQVLDELLSKLDNKAWEQWPYAPRVTLSAKKLPTIFAGGHASDLSWSCLQSLAHEWGLIELKLKHKHDPFLPDYQGARLILKQHAEAVLRDWLKHPQQATDRQQWLAALAEYADKFPGNIHKLQSRTISAPEKSAIEIIEAFHQIHLYQHDRLSLRQLSTRCFWGDSKFLDNKEEHVLTLYPDINIAPRPVLVNAYLPKQLKGVLLIENLDSYLALTQQPSVSSQDLALVFCSGYKASAKRIREQEGASIFLQGNFELKEVFSSWWLAPEAESLPVFFWGDLDFSGMSILAALREPFQTISAWQPGYQILLSKLQSTQSHTPDSSDKQNQVDPGITGCTYADEVLLPALRAVGRFIDQEIVSIERDL